MLPYELLMGAAALLGILLCELKRSRRSDLIYLVLMTTVMVAMAALRAPSVGVDYPVYAEHFQMMLDQDLPTLFENGVMRRTELGYGLLTFLISRVTQDVRVFMGIISALIIAPRAVAVYRQSSSVWVSTFVFVSFGFFSYALCTLRQELAITVAMFAVPYLQKKKPIPYFLLILLAAFLHKSIIVLLPLYFLANLPLGWKTLSVYTGGAIFVLAFSWPIINFVTQYVYKHYAPGQPGAYYLKPRDFNTAFIPIIVFIVVMVLRKRLLKQNPRNIVLMNFSCYAAFLYMLTMKHFIFQRLALLVFPLSALLIIPEIVVSYRVDHEKYLAIENEYKSADKGRQKQLLHDYNQNKIHYREAKGAYKVAIGTVIFAGFLYQLFLLNANRLLLVPYTTFL